MQKLKIITVSLLAISALNLSSCATSKNNTGREFRVENLTKVEIGMSQQDILELLGAPYAITTSQITGKSKYEYNIVSGTSAGGGVFLFIGVAEIKGANASIEFDSEKKVEKITYEMIDESLYEEYGK